MKHAIFLFFLAIAPFLISGCTHTHRNCTPQYLDDKLRGQRLNINTLAGPVRNAELIEISADSVYWRNIRGLHRSIGNSSLIGLEARRSGYGALEGLFFGVLGGAAIGWAKGYSEGDYNGYVTFTAEDKARWVGFIGAITGGFSGAIIGAIIGSKHVYLVGTAASDTVR